MKKSNYPAVYVQTNEADGNQVIAFRREAGRIAVGDRRLSHGRPRRRHAPSHLAGFRCADGRRVAPARHERRQRRRESSSQSGDDGLSLLETVATGAGAEERRGARRRSSTCSTPRQPSLVGFRLERSRADRRVRARRGLGPAPRSASLPTARASWSPTAATDAIVQFPVDGAGRARRAQDLAVLGADAVRVRLRGRHARGHRGVRRGEGQGGRLVVSARRRRGDAGSRARSATGAARSAGRS